MRIALLTLEAAAASRAVRRFVTDHPDRIALLGLSDPFRPQAGGAFGQTLRRLRSSGPGILPYLFVNFSLPRLAGALRRGGTEEPDRAPLSETCRRLGIPAVDVTDVNGAAFRQRLVASEADLILTFHFDQILAAETIDAAPLGGINVHPGLLPMHRGPVPTIHALLDEPVELGVTVHRLTPRIDAGEILAQSGLPDEPSLTAISAADRLHWAALPLLDHILADLPIAIAEGRRPAPLPYRPFPSRSELRQLRRKGRRTADWRDVMAAWRLGA